MRQPRDAARSIQSWRPMSPPHESTTRSFPASSVRGAVSSRRCACVDASITRSEARTSASRERNGAGEPRLFRKRSAFSWSRAVAPARWRPAMPSSRARQSCRPIAPSPTTPTSMIAHGIMPPGTRMTAAERLRQPLERLYREFDYATRVELDAIRFPLRYAAPRDRQLVGLPAACLPYGRLNLFLRWRVRREPPDFGLWTSVSPSRLVMPIDTHIENISRSIGLTRRRSRSWRMAEEITGRLAAVDGADPVKFDFALCHKRMSGDCLDRRDAKVCGPCGFKAVCRHWRGRGAPKARHGR